jgi:hypothetical protein
MGLSNTVRSGIATIKKVTTDLQTYVDIEPWTGLDPVTTAATYGSAVRIPAIVTMGPMPFRSAIGEVIVVQATVLIIEPVSDNGAANRAEPIDPRDRITLSDGTSGPPIMSAGSIVDPLTDKPYLFEMAIG